MPHFFLSEVEVAGNKEY